MQAFTVWLLFILLAIAVAIGLCQELVREVFAWGFRRRDDGTFSFAQRAIQAIFIALAAIVIGLALYAYVARP